MANSKRTILLAAAITTTMLTAGAFAQTTPTAPNNSTLQRPTIPPGQNDPGRTTAATNRTPVATPVNTGSLLQQSGGSLLRASLNLPADSSRAKLKDISFIGVPEPEPRTLKKHDLITIVVREESAFSSKATADIKREADLEAKVDEFIKLKLGNFAIQGGAAGPTPPSIKMSANRNFKGEATNDRTDSLTARITGEVVDVKPNGTLVVQARKTIKTDDEEQQFVLTGICRAEDVNADNTVLSTQLYDLALQKNHKGAVRDGTKRGLVHQLLDFLNPF